MRSRRFAAAGAALLALAVAAFAPVPVAAAKTVLPPGNSAANQYTEAFPTQGGSTPTGDKGHSTPARALGAKNAKRLEAQGADGRAAAEVAAATAPPAQSAGGSAAGGSKPTPGASGAGATPAEAGSGSGSAQGSGSSTESPSTAAGGSSGFGRVLGQATGSSSSGRLGLFLPLLIVAALVWSVAYTFRRRRRAGH
jgi:cobalamin biosynthesis Mg chelatase CobN